MDSIRVLFINIDASILNARRNEIVLVKSQAIAIANQLDHDIQIQILKSKVFQIDRMCLNLFFVYVCSKNSTFV